MRYYMSRARAQVKKNVTKGVKDTPPPPPSTAEERSRLTLRAADELRARCGATVRLFNYPALERSSAQRIASDVGYRQGTR